MTAEEFMDRMFPGAWVCGQIRSCIIGPEGIKEGSAGSWECALHPHPPDVPDPRADRMVAMDLKKATRGEAIEAFARIMGWTETCVIPRPASCGQEHGAPVGHDSIEIPVGATGGEVIGMMRRAATVEVPTSLVLDILDVLDACETCSHDDDRKKQRVHDALQALCPGWPKEGRSDEQ